MQNLSMFVALCVVMLAPVAYTLKCYECQYIPVTDNTDAIGDKSCETPTEDHLTTCEQGTKFCAKEFGKFSGKKYVGRGCFPAIQGICPEGKVDHIINDIKMQGESTCCEGDKCNVAPSVRGPLTWKLLMITIATAIVSTIF